MGILRPFRGNNKIWMWGAMDVGADKCLAIPRKTFKGQAMQKWVGTVWIEPGYIIYEDDGFQETEKGNDDSDGARAYAGDDQIDDSSPSQAVIASTR